MQLFSRSGHFVRRIQIKFIDIVAGLAINQQGGFHDVGTNKSAFQVKLLPLTVLLLESLLYQRRVI